MHTLTHTTFAANYFLNFNKHCPPKYLSFDTDSSSFSESTSDSSELSLFMTVSFFPVWALHNWPALGSKTIFHFEKSVLYSILFAPIIL